MNKIAVEMVSADKTIFEGECDLLSATALSGEIGIMYGHVPLLSELKPGHITIKNDDNELDIFISGGFIEVQPKKITILADAAERVGEIDEADAIRMKQEAEAAIQSASGVDYQRVQRELLEAAARVALIQKVKTKR